MVFIFMRLKDLSLIYKGCELIKSLYTYNKEKNYISDTFYSDEFKFVLKRYLNLTVKKDWYGRLYGVINPMINNNGELDVSTTIIEIDGDNTNSNEYVKVWAYKQLRLIGTLFKINKLYDYINVDFEHVGPENQDNYLLIFDITSRKYFAECLKSFGKHLLFYIITAAIVAGILLII